MRESVLRGVATAALLLLYLPTLAQLANAWRTDTYAGHGMFVPLFSAMLLWSDRGGLRRAVGSGSASGLPLLLSGLALLALATWQKSLLLAGLSFPVSLSGLIWCLFGKKLLDEALFPIGFLALWVPLPRSVVALVTQDVQELVAGMAAGLVGALGIPVYQQGTLLVLSTASLEVVEGCNGLRFMMALLVLAVAYAHVSQRSRGRKIALALSAIPIAVLANGVRIAVIAVAAHFYGSQAAEGLLHNWIGKSVWGVALVGLGLFGFMLRGRSNEAEGQAGSSTAQSENRTNRSGS